MFSLSRGRRPSAASGTRRPFSSRRLGLEALEARWLPATPAPAAVPAATTVANDTAVVAAALVPPAPALPAQALPGQAPALPPVIDPGPLGFPGRVVFPGTGLQARSVTAPGPMGQPPGAFLVGGTGAAQPADPNAPPAQTGLADASGDVDRAALLDLLYTTPP